MSMTQDETPTVRDTTPTPKPTPTKPRPAGTPGGIPAIPAVSIAAATTTAAVGALGAATGGVGVAVLAGAGALAAGTGAVRAARSGGMGRMTTTRTITKTSGTKTSGGTRSRGALGKALGRSGRVGGGSGRGKSGGLLSRKTSGRGTGAGAGSGKRSPLAGARNRAAAIAAARRTRPADPTARRTGQAAARRAKVERARNARTAAAAARRLTAARKGAGMKSGMKSAGKSGRTGGLLGKSSPYSRMAKAHKQNQRANTRAAKAAARRRQRQQAADKRRNDRVMGVRHRIRTGGPRKPTSSAERKAALARKRAAKRRRAAMWGATTATGARLIKGSRRAGGGLRDTYRDTLTHLLGGAALLEGLEQARLFNEANGIRPIPQVPDSLVHRRTPLQTSGPRTNSEVNPMFHPFNLLPEAEDMLMKIQRAEVGGMLGVVQAFHHLPKAIETMSSAYTVLAGKAASEMPLHPEIGAALEQVHLAFKAAIQAAEGIGPLTEKLHEHDIERLRNPRNGEEGWDVIANRD